VLPGPTVCHVDGSELNSFVDPLESRFAARAEHSRGTSQQKLIFSERSRCASERLVHSLFILSNLELALVLRCIAIRDIGPQTWKSIKGLEGV
jgi:hypothetical protein